MANGSFVPIRENDVLTKALGNPEHAGRTRSIGAVMCWKDGFEDSEEAPKKKSQTWKEKEEEITERIRAEVTNQFRGMVKEMEEFRERVTSYMQSKGIQSFDDLPSPGVRRSSCASRIEVDPLDLIEVFNTFPI